MKNQRSVLGIMSSPKIQNTRSFLFRRERTENKRITERLVSTKEQAHSHDGGDSVGSTCLGESRG
jgi:hypothetical protein